MRFSQRMGYTPIKQVIQVDTMDSELRTGLWNVLSETIWYAIQYTPAVDFFKSVWRDYFKEPLDTLPNGVHSFIHEVREYFFNEAQWYEVYDFIEFVADIFPFDNYCDKLKELCNVQFEKELSGYRFINGKITPITSKEEIKSIELALQNTDTAAPVKSHLERAIELLSDKKSPDYRNSIKESVSAIEALSKLITKSEKATLGEALNIMKKEGNIDIHGSLLESFKKVYGYTSDADGIRHALMEKDNLASEDAIYMLVSCSAFINYLITKSTKANIQLN